MRKLIAMALCVAATGCGADETLDPAPGLPVPVGEWQAIETGGETICSRGTPYSFFVRGGHADKLIIDFRGGGACWNSLTCSVAGALFAEEVGELDDLLDRIGKDGIGGIYHDDHEDYPFANWTLVHVPYCTGDIHWGDATVDYGAFELHHKGFVNTQAVLSWVYENYPDPEHVLVTGCSAGAYGAIFHSAYIAAHYQDASIRVLGDSGAGIITSTFFEESFPNWNATDHLPPNVPRLQKPPAELTSADLYAGVAQAFPDHRFAHYSSNYDADQTFYFTAMGGAAGEWPGLLRARMQECRAQADNFRYYISPGPVHCITPYDFMFARRGDTPFIDWLTDYVYAEAPPDDVACQGAACDTDPLCDACKNGTPEAGVWCGFCDGWPEDYVGIE